MSHAMQRSVACLLLVAAALVASPVARAQTQSFESGGVQLHYTSIGTGTPVVLLSGGPGLDVGYVLPVAAFLPPGQRAIAFEQRGSGRSRPQGFDAATLTLHGAVLDLEALRVHLRQERLSLLGHSWGGMLAMAYAAAYPERIESLILVGSGGPTLEFAQWFGDNIEARLRPEDLAMRDYWTQAAQRGVDAEKVAIETLRAIAPGYFFDRSVGLAFAGELRDGQYHPDVNAALFADMGASYDLREGLKRLARPVLILQGHQDPIGDRTAEDIRALVPKSTLVYFQRCGHFPWLEQPEAFQNALAEFLATPPR